MYNEVFKDLHRRTVSDNVLRDKAFIVAKNPKCYGCQQGHASTCSIFFDKKLLSDAIKLAHKSAIKREIMTKENCY